MHEVSAVSDTSPFVGFITWGSLLLCWNTAMMTHMQSHLQTWTCTCYKLFFNECKKASHNPEAELFPKVHS